jgi:hypothetical protein
VLWGKELREILVAEKKLGGVNEWRDGGDFGGNLFESAQLRNLRRKGAGVAQGVGEEEVAASCATEIAREKSCAARNNGSCARRSLGEVASQAGAWDAVETTLTLALSREGRGDELSGGWETGKAGRESIFRNLVDESKHQAPASLPGRTGSLGS